MQKQYVKKISAMTLAGLFGFGIGQVIADVPAALKLEASHPSISLYPNDPGAMIRLSVIDAAGNRATTTNDVTVSVTSGGAFGVHTLSAMLPRDFSVGDFPVGGKDGLYKATTAGNATLQAAFTSPTSLQSNILNIDVTDAAECDGLEIDDTNLGIGSSSDPSSRAKAVGGTSVEDGKPACDGAKVKPGQKAITKFKLRVAPQHVARSGRTFLLLYIQKSGERDGRFFDLGGFRYVDLKPGAIGAFGAWGGLGRAGDFAQLPSEIDLFDFDAQTQMMFYGSKIADFNFPAGTNLMWIGGYTLKGTSKAYFAMTSLTIE